MPPPPRVSPSPNDPPNDPRNDPSTDRPLRIAYLCYRGKPHVGGQGVYTRHLTKALADLGHHVEVLGGQPYPVLDDRVPLHRLPSLDIYNDHYPMRFPWIGELRQWTDWLEVAQFSVGSFPEPLAFSLRARGFLRRQPGRFDVVHDNQCLGYGLLGIEHDGLPVVATIHHPITVDRRLEREHARTRWERFSKTRWYGFARMQTRVAQRLPRIITVSESSARDLVAEFQLDPARVHVVPVGVDVDVFRPRPDVAVVPGRLITTASADVALKGLRYLLEALAKVRTERPDTHLVVVGRRKEGGPSAEAIRRLGLDRHVEFVSGVSEERIIELYSEAELAVVPSLYEGFSLPAIEAQSCGVPLVATTGGAIPEVVGADGDTAILVPPADSEALAGALLRHLGTTGTAGDLRRGVGARGRRRVVENWSWAIMARRTVEHYRARLLEPRRQPLATRVLTVDYDRLGLEPGDRLLDIGAGRGRHVFEAYRRGAVAVACDLDQEVLTECHVTLGAMRAAGEALPGTAAGAVGGSVLALPFDAESFDRVIASEVLEHVACDLAALAELHRVLRPGGTLAVTVPAWLPETICWRLSAEYPAPVSPGGHVRIYSETVLRARLHQSGYVPGASHHAHALHSPYWWLRCAVGLQRADHPAVRAYHRLLVWDITRRPLVTRAAERALRPVIGKSLVVYARRCAPTGRAPSRRRRPVEAPDR